jgi:hypothetical protein
MAPPFARFAVGRRPMNWSSNQWRLLKYTPYKGWERIDDYPTEKDAIDSMKELIKAQKNMSYYDENGEPLSWPDHDNSSS